MYKLNKSKSNPSKFTLHTPTSRSSKLPLEFTKTFLHRSVSGSKKVLHRNIPLSPSGRRKEYHSGHETKININNLNLNLLICNNKEQTSSIPFTMRSLQTKIQQTPMVKTKYFKTNNTFKNMSKLNETMEQKKKTEVTSRYSFEPIKVLAKGQYGNLYLAYLKSFNFIVVLKSFNKEKVTLDFMIDEFKIQLYCKHPNILPAYGFFFGKTEAYLIMEAGSHNLYKIIKEAGYLSESKSATYIHQILKGLSYLHLNGIIHRDIKPENIIVCGGVLKISDFGWSVITNSERKTFCGTLDYVSPEVCSGIPYDNKIDCWSIGVLAFELMTGFPPFEEYKGKKDRPILNYSQKIKFPVTISKLGKEFIMRMLSINPNERPSAVQALRDPWIEKFSQESFKCQSSEPIFEL